MNKLNDIMNNKSIFYKVGMFLIILIILMVIPWGLELLIFRNNIYSVIGNEYWSSFLGSYIGGVIGGAGTLFAVLITTKETRVIQKKNEDQMEIDRAEKRKNERKLLVDSVIEDIAKILSNLVTYKDGCVHLQKCEEKIKEFNATEFEGEEIKGDTAKVFVKGDKKPITLVKVDGDWKVDMEK